MTTPNPYATPLTTGHDAEPAARIPRTLFWSGVVLIQALFYAAYVLFISIVGTSMLVAGSFGGGRTEEVALLLLAFAAYPFVLWCMVQEFLGVRSVVPQREMLLSRLNLWSVAAPIAMSVFWMYEYFAFGSFEANAVPATLAMGFSAVWLTGGYMRLRNARAMM